MELNRPEDRIHRAGSVSFDDTLFRIHRRTFEFNQTYPAGSGVEILSAEEVEEVWVVRALLISHEQGRKYFEALKDVVENVEVNAWVFEGKIHGTK